MVLIELKIRCDPRMIGGILQTAKRLVECEITNYIEGCPVEPANHVLRSPGRVLIKPLYQEVHVARDD
jgi:hypothetical protein